MKHEAFERAQENGEMDKYVLIQEVAAYPDVIQHLIGKTSIAWFKLADVLARGEKERTLSIYRLLIHSIHHDAIKAQLEGDILRSFNDPNAVQSYIKAADLYQKNGEFSLAVVLYESIIVTFLTAGRPFERLLLNRSIAAVCNFYREHDDARLSPFLAKLAALDEQAHGYAKNCL